MQLTDGDKKCVLKLCVYKTPFGKSDHKCVMQVTDFKIGCFIGLFHLPQRNLATYIWVQS